MVIIIKKPPNQQAISSEIHKGSSVRTYYIIGGASVINCFEAQNKAERRGVNHKKVFIKMLTILISLKNKTKF